MILEKIPGLMKSLDKLARISDAKSIARRLFVTNSFDCLMTSLGVILGGYIGGIDSPKAFIGTVLGGSLTMGVFSGFLGAFFSERAERKRELKRMEFQVQRDLSKSIYGKASRIIPVYVALWSAAGIFMFPVITITPFILSSMGILSVTSSVVASIAIINILIFTLGCYLGKISGEGILRNGVIMLTISLAATVMLLIISAITR